MSIHLPPIFEEMGQLGLCRGVPLWNLSRRSPPMCMSHGPGPPQTHESKAVSEPHIRSLLLLEEFRSKRNPDKTLHKKSKNEEKNETRKKHKKFLILDGTGKSRMKQNSAPKISIGWFLMDDAEILHPVRKWQRQKIDPWGGVCGRCFF